MKNTLVFMCVLLTIGIFFSSCKNTSVTDAQLPQTENQQPVVHPLKFNGVKRIDPASIKTIAIHPIVKKMDFNKLPVHSYDTAASRPIRYNIEETKTDYSALPEKNFDVEKLPSKPSKQITYKLPPPKTIKSGQPHLKDASLSLFELAEAQGLQGVLITCVFTDKAGFLWIATGKGLYRYDGENLLLYIDSPETYITGMLEDDLGRIWMSTLGSGVEILDTANGTLQKIVQATGLGNNNLCYILQDGQKRIWATSSKPAGVNIVDQKSLSVKWLDKSYGLADSHVNGLTMDHSGQIWISTNKGINIINPTTRKIKILSKSAGLKSDTTGNLFCDHNGDIWMDNSGANIFSPQNNSFKTIKDERFFKNNPLIGFSEDIKGRIWVASQKNGLAIIDQSNYTLQNLKQANGLNYDFILSICPDKKNQAWIPTLKGLNKLSYNNNLAEHIGNRPVPALAEDKQNFIWDGSDKGINIVNRKNKTYVHFGTAQGSDNDTIQCIIEKHNNIFIGSNEGLDVIDSSRTTITHIGVKQGLKDAVIETIMVDNHDNIWLGELNNGIDIYDPTKSTLKHIGKAQGLDNNITDIKQDMQGNIWVATSVDIYKITADLKAIQNLHLAKGNKTVVIDHYGNAWIGTPKGIFIADQLNKHLITFSTQQGLIDKQVISLLKYNNRIYAGTLGGVTVVSPPVDGLSVDKKWEINSFGIRYGLTKINSGYFLTDMITRDGLYCWGDNGISVFDFTKKDTAVSPVYITGINIMDDHQYFTANKRSDSSAYSWDKITGPNNLPVNLHLAYNQNYVQFNYNVLNLTAHDTTWYQYRLIGADKKWNTITSSNSSKSYYNLSPGQYTFEVTGKTIGENWSKTVSLSFTINPPWWQTWWAYILYVILFSSALWGFGHFRSRKLVQDKLMLEHKVHLRTEEVLQQKEEIEAQRDNLEKAFSELKTTQNQLVQSEKMASLGELTAGIAHEIQNPLNFVNNFSEVNKEMLEELKEELKSGNIEEALSIAEDIRQNEEKITHHGKRADFIVKGMLQHSRTSKGERQPTNINLLADEFLKLSYHGLRAKDKNFNAGLTTNFDENLPKINVVQQDIGRVLLNLFNNAFYAVNQKKKTSGTDYKPEVTVTTELVTPPLGAGGVTISVRDNGIGIPGAVKDKIMQPFFTTKPTGEGTGLGLSLSYDMVVKGHNGSIQVNSVEGQGSEFIISLPLA